MTKVHISKASVVNVTSVEGGRFDVDAALKVVDAIVAMTRGIERKRAGVGVRLAAGDGAERGGRVVSTVILVGGGKRVTEVEGRKSYCGEYQGEWVWSKIAHCFALETWDRIFGVGFKRYWMTCDKRYLPLEE